MALQKASLQVPSERARVGCCLCEPSVSARSQAVEDKSGRVRACVRARAGVLASGVTAHTSLAAATFQLHTERFLQGG